MNYGLIGCGRISPNHIEAAKENRMNIIALCDVSKEKIEKIIEKHNLPSSVKKYTDYIEMLEGDKLDLVAIATESGNHAKIALDCIDKGVHLIIEKPIALSLTDADEIIEAAEKKGVKVSACHQNRFNKSIKKIREALEAGRFGKLLHGTAHVRWNRGEEYYKQAPWRGTWEQDGGALMNQCIHNIDLLRWMLGDEIVEVIGMTDRLCHDYIEAEDLGLALVRFANGSYGVIEGTTNTYPNNLEETLYIFGEKGTVKAGGKSVNIIEEWRFEDNLDKPKEVKEKYQENPPSVYGFGHIPLYKDVKQAIEEGRPVYVDAYAGKRALELVLAIYESSLTGKSVKLPMERGSTLDSVGRFERCSINLD